MAQMDGDGGKAGRRIRITTGERIDGRRGINRRENR